MPKRLTFQDAKKVFDDRGYTLLETEYKNTITKMRYVCPNHPDKENSITTKDLKNGFGCPYCAGNMKYTFEVVKSEFEKRGYELLETEYKNAHASMKYKCLAHPDKNLSIRFHHLLKNHKCPYCAGRAAPDLETIKEEFAKRGMILLSSEYKNNNTPLEYVCTIHNNTSKYIKWNTFQSMKVGCPDCANEKKSRGEMAIADILREYQIFYINNYKFNDCRYKNRLPFDFFVNNRFIVEYDGEQHFYPIDFAGRGQSWAIKSYNNVKKRDSIKNEYCIKNNIPIYRIPYWEYENIRKIIIGILNKHSLVTRDKTMNVEEFFINKISHHQVV